MSNERHFSKKSNLNDKLTALLAVSQHYRVVLVEQLPMNFAESTRHPYTGALYGRLSTPSQRILPKNLSQLKNVSIEVSSKNFP